MIWYVTPLPWLLPGSAASLVISLLASGPVGRWLGARRSVAGLMLLTIGIILSGTVTPLARDFVEGEPSGCDLTRIRPATLAEIFGPSDVLGNIVMFVPLGFAVGLIPGSRRKAAVVVGVVALPFVVELVQLVATRLNRGCESADVVDNLTGLVIGLGAGFVVSRVAPSTRTQP